MVINAVKLGNNPLQMEYGFRNINVPFWATFRSEYSLENGMPGVPFQVSTPRKDLGGQIQYMIQQDWRRGHGASIEGYQKPNPGAGRPQRHDEPTLKLMLRKSPWE